MDDDLLSDLSLHLGLQFFHQFWGLERYPPLHVLVEPAPQLLLRKTHVRADLDPADPDFALPRIQAINLPPVGPAFQVNV